MICDTCGEDHPSTRERDNGHTTCDACWTDALAYGHFHGMHQGEDGLPERVEGCPTCAGQPSAYPLTHPYHPASCERVVKALRARGFQDAEYEYPGYVSLPVGDGARVIVTGVANPTWTIDLQSADGAQTLDGTDTGIVVSKDGHEVEAVTDALIRWARDNGHLE